MPCQQIYLCYTYAAYIVYIRARYSIYIFIYMVYYSSIIYINNILKYFYFYIKCVSLFSFASFLFFFAYTDWIQIGYRLDTKCIHLSKVSIYAACSCFYSLVFAVLLTTWQPKKSPSFSAGAKCNFFQSINWHLSDSA